jgi:hypothetical protein
MPSRGFKSMPDTIKTTTPSENTDDQVVDAVTSGLRAGIHTIHVTDEEDGIDYDVALARYAQEAGLPGHTVAFPRRPAPTPNYFATPFPPNVVTEADAIPGEDDFRPRWVTVVAVDDTD